MMKRKRRSDRNHVIYKLTCIATGETYVGLTQVYDRDANKSIHTRWLQHLSRSRTQNKSWALYDRLRKYDSAQWKVALVEIVRGKINAHARECAIMSKVHAQLNTRMAG